MNQGRRRGKVLSLVVWASGATAVAAPPNLISKDDFQTLIGFEAKLNSIQSASEALRLWCVDRRMAAAPVIRAVRMREVEKPAGDDDLRPLGAGPAEAIRYRRVRLVCGEHVLSEADNWYRPALLTPEMNRLLDESDTPFGLVVRPLNFQRKTIAVQWLVAPARHSHRRRERAAIPRELLRHTAVLKTADGTPFSLVVETYGAEILSKGPTGLVSP